MNFRISLVLVVAVLFGCQSTAPPALTIPELEGPREVMALAQSEGSVHVVVRDRGECFLHTLPLGEQSWSLVEPGRPVSCPDRIELTGDGDVLLFGDRGGHRVDQSPSDDRLLAYVNPSSFVERSADSGVVWKLEGRDWSLNALESPVTILGDGSAVIAVEPSDEVVNLVRFDLTSDGELRRTLLSEGFERVDSISVDRDGKELVISALRDGSRDIAIVNAERPVMNWVPADGSDEIDPVFSPVGYKVSYVVRAPTGDVLRTIHVPTAAMVIADFDASTIADYTWLPDGERVIVAVSSPLASSHLVEVAYEGSNRRIVMEPELRFDRDIDRLPGTPAGSILLPPQDLGYEESRPLVIWEAGPGRAGLEFDVRLVPLLERSDVALFIINGEGRSLAPSFWEALRQTGWIDPERLWIVSDEEVSSPEGMKPRQIRKTEAAAAVVLSAIDGNSTNR